MGRTGKLFAHQWGGVTPDIMAVAKALGNGFPIGACLATEKAAVGMVPGSHGSTFGGNPMAVAAANAVLDVMLAPGFFDTVNANAKYLWGKLETLVAKYPKLFERVRGSGHAGRHPLRRHRRRRRRQGARAGSVGADRGRQRAAHPAAADDHPEARSTRRSRSSTRWRANGPRNESGGGPRLPGGRYPDRRAARGRAAPPLPRHRPVRDARAAGDARPRRRLQERPRRPAARRQDAGDDLREAVDPHPRVVRGGDAPARRRHGHPRHRRTASSAAARPSPTPPGCCRAMSTRS